MSCNRENGQWDAQVWPPVCPELVSTNQESPCPHLCRVWGGQGGLPVLISPDTFHWQRPTFSWRFHICLGRGQGPFQAGGNSQTLPSALSSRPRRPLSGTTGLLTLAALSAPTEVCGGRQAQGECDEMDSPHSKTGGRGVGMLDQGEAERRPEPWGQCLTSIIWRESP